MTTPVKRGTFPAGKSGNPAGRPPGSGEAAAWRAAIGKDVRKVIAVVTQLALSGDAACCRLVLERAVPAYRPIDAVSPLPIPAGATLSLQAAAVIQAVAAGVIPITQGAQLVSAIGAMQNIISTDDIARRIAEIETRINHEKP